MADPFEHVESDEGPVHESTGLNTRAGEQHYPVMGSSYLADGEEIWHLCEFPDCGIPLTPEEIEAWG